MMQKKILNSIVQR